MSDTLVASEGLDSLLANQGADTIEGAVAADNSAPVADSGEGDGAPVEAASPKPRRARRTAADAAKVWVVSPSSGLRLVSAAEGETILEEPGARLATKRDIALGG